MRGHLRKGENGHFATRTNDSELGTTQRKAVCVFVCENVCVCVYVGRSHAPTCMFLHDVTCMMIELHA